MTWQLRYNVCLAKTLWETNYLIQKFVCPVLTLEAVLSIFFLTARLVVGQVTFVI